MIFLQESHQLYEYLVETKGLWVKGPPKPLFSKKPGPANTGFFIRWHIYVRGGSSPSLISFILIFWVSFCVWRSLWWIFLTSCNHPGGFQDLSTPWMMSDSWLWGPGLFPSFSGCCCWLPEHAAGGESVMTPGSQIEASLALAPEWSSGMQGDRQMAPLIHRTCCFTKL